MNRPLCAYRIAVEPLSPQHVGKKTIKAKGHLTCPDSKGYSYLGESGFSFFSFITSFQLIVKTACFPFCSDFLKKSQQFVVSYYNL